MGDGGFIQAFGDWIVVNNTFLSGLAAFLAIVSVIVLALRRTFGAVSLPFLSKIRTSETEDSGTAIGKRVDKSPAIAVLPFRTISKGEDEQYLADGIAEDLIVSLSYSRLVPIISSATSFRYRNSDKSIYDAGQEMGARYISTGTVRSAGDKLIITVELDDCKTESQIWSERYIRTSDDLFKLQEEISDTLISQLDPALRAAEISRARRKESGNAKAYDYLLKGLWYHNKYRESEHKMAIEQFRAAIKADAEYAYAHAMLANAHYTSAYLDWSENAMVDFVAAGDSARTAIELDPNLAEGYVVLTYCALILRDFQLSDQMCSRALELNPCNAYTWFASGLVALYRGRFERAIECFERVERLNSSDPMIWIFLLAMSVAKFMMSDFEGALKYTQRARTHEHGVWPGGLISCAALMELGREDEARAVIESYENQEEITVRWGVSVSRMPFEDVALLARFINPVRRLDPDLLEQVAAPVGQSQNMEIAK